MTELMIARSEVELDEEAFEPQEIEQVEDHPILDLAAEALEEGNEASGLELSGAGMGSLRAALSDLIGSTELVLAVDALSRLALSLIQSESPRAASALLGLIDEAPVVDALRRIVSLAREVSAQDPRAGEAGEAFGRFADRARPGLPLGEGSVRPAGTVNLDALVFPRRI